MVLFELYWGLRIYDGFSLWWLNYDLSGYEWVCGYLLICEGWLIISGVLGILLLVISVWLIGIFNGGYGLWDDVVVYWLSFKVFWYFSIFWRN